MSEMTEGAGFGDQDIDHWFRAFCYPKYGDLTGMRIEIDLMNAQASFENAQALVKSQLSECHAETLIEV